MSHPRSIIGLLALAGSMVGCSGGTVTQSDTAKVRQEFSQENYEKAMQAAGKGAELEAEKQKAAARGEQ